MKIARYRVGTATSFGVVIEDAIVDLPKAGVPDGCVLEIISGGHAHLANIAAAVRGAKPHVSLADVELLAPYRPLKYLAIGMNYRKHAEEARRLGAAVPQMQLWFNKQTSCIAGPNEDIDPGVSEKLDYEVELGVIIGQPGKRIAAKDALEHVFGYVVVNDVSARDWQFHSPTFTVGKSFDTHGPFGPWIVTADEIPDPQALNIRCLVNGKVRQESNTADMIHSVAQQIEYLSTAFTLESGDLLATGTPAGVGVAMTPPQFLKPGDVVRCEVDKIGSIENRVAMPAV